MYVNGFSAKERLSFISIIRQNLLVIIMTILKEMEELKIVFSEEVSTLNFNLLKGHSLIMYVFDQLLVPLNTISL